MFTDVKISGTTTKLRILNGHTFTCTLVGSDAATDLQYQWRIGAIIKRPFSNNNQFVISPVTLSDARSDYFCDVMVRETGAIFTGIASLNVASE